jgi:hypothetical protein
MKTIKWMPLLTAGLIVLLMASCGPAYVNTGAGYGPGYYGARPYYGYNYGYRPYGYYRPPVVVAPPVVVRPRYYTPTPRPRYYGGSPNARGGFGGGYGNGRARGPR